jgi:hypothetical protein
MFSHLGMRLALSGLVCLFPLRVGHATTAIDTNFVNKSVVFFFAADSAGHVLPNKQIATGFLVMVPSAKTGQPGYPFLVTARHVVDPVWAGCERTNPTRLFVRINNMRFDPKKDESVGARQE